MLNSSLSPWPSFTNQEAQAVAKVIASNRVNYWTGQEGREFEREFANWSGSNHAIALANGTLALDLALRGLGVGAHNGGTAEDEVIVTPRSFIASVSCVVNAGAKPVFADVDLSSGNLSPTTIEPKISKLTKAVIPVHIGGWPCDMDAIMALSERYGFFVIEDCAQAHGAKINGKSVGSFGHAGAWSFCQDKIMTTGGEGGMVTANNPDLWERMWSFKDHGKSWDAVYNRDHPPGFRWLHESIGTNWRMMEMQSVIGRIQLSRMDAWQKRREYIANAVYNVLDQYRAFIRVPRPPDHYQHANYRCYAYVKPEALPDGWTRDMIVNAIVDAGIPAFQGTCSEIYNEKAFDGLGVRPKQPLPNAKKLGETSMMFLTHPTITDDELTKICTVIDDVMGQVQ